MKNELTILKKEKKKHASEALVLGAFLLNAINAGPFSAALTYTYGEQTHLHFILERSTMKTASFNVALRQRLANNPHSLLSHYYSYLSY